MFEVKDMKVFLLALESYKLDVVFTDVTDVLSGNSHLFPSCKRICCKLLESINSAEFQSFP